MQSTRRRGGEAKANHLSTLARAGCGGTSRKQRQVLYLSLGEANIQNGQAGDVREALVILVGTNETSSLG